MTPSHLTRRSFIVGGTTGLCLARLTDMAAAAATPLNMQLGWLGGGNQLGEVCALRLGYFEQEGLDFKIQPGGPNNDGIAVVASGRYEVGQVSSSPSLMLAVSQDLPIKCFAVSAQKHPYAFFSLPKNPVREPADFRGKRVGIQATGVILLRALMAKNRIDPDEVKIVTIGSDMAPLLTGQVDVVTGWVTNVTALSVLGSDRIALRLWDTGGSVVGQSAGREDNTSRPCHRSRHISYRTPLSDWVMLRNQSRICSGRSRADGIPTGGALCPPRVQEHYRDTAAEAALRNRLCRRIPVEASDRLRGKTRRCRNRGFALRQYGRLRQANGLPRTARS